MKNLRYDGLRGDWVKKSWYDKHPYIATTAIVVAFYAAGFLIFKLIG